MNQRSAKRLRKLLNPQEETTKKVYRRLKKSWDQLQTKEEKENFLKASKL